MTSTAPTNAELRAGHTRDLQAATHAVLALRMSQNGKLPTLQDVDALAAGILPAFPDADAEHVISVIWSAYRPR